MSIYTRRGDEGETSLADGTRIGKASSRVEAYGTLDEASSLLGLARASTSEPDLAEVLRFAQQRLFNCASALATPVAPAGAAQPIAAEDIAALEDAIDAFETATGPLGGFVMTGGCETAARLHVARAVVRRAERRVVALARVEPVDEFVLAFLNRLSDALFAAARYANHLAGAPDEPWEASCPPPRLPELRQEP